jgi:signal transduction histidine kinase
VRWPIRYQILIPFAGVMLVALVLVSALNAWLSAKRVATQTSEQLRHIADTLHDSNFPLTSTVLKQTKGLSGAEFVLTTPAGDVLETTIPGLHALPAMASAPFELGPATEVDGELYFQTTVLLSPRAGRSEPQLLHILYPESSWREARWQSAWPPLAFGGAALALVVALAVTIAARLSRPIGQLRSQAGRLAQGHFEPVPLPARDDELRDLVTSINLLASQLDELQQAIKRSERLMLLGQLGGGLAHSLRNDVTGAKLALQLHQRNCRQTDQQSLAVALRQLTLTEELLQRFLALGRPQAPSRVDCDLAEVIDETIALVQPACRHRKIALDVLKNATRTTRLFADPEQLRQALLNLALNAIDAAGPGGKVWLELAESPGDELIVRVCDSGTGPPPELVERIFDPLVTGKPEGVGLGLAVVRQIAEAHGGRAELKSGTPTCFELLLPIGAPIKAEATVNREPSTSVA